MSDSVRSHRLQPTWLPHPWDSPGENTGVGCHFFLQCMKVKSEGEVAQSCPTLSDPMDYSLPGSSVHGIFQARVLEWGAITFSKYQKHNLQKILINWNWVTDDRSGRKNFHCIYFCAFWMYLVNAHVSLKKKKNNSNLSLLGIYPRDVTSGIQTGMCTLVFTAALFTTAKVEATQASINRRTDIQNVADAYNGILVHLKKEEHSDTCCNIIEH